MAFNPVSKLPGAIAQRPGGNRFFGGDRCLDGRSLFLGMRYPSYNVLRVIIENSSEP
ncbi:hypothetical protein [Laspinema olomoucense]|uniref:hypothetical protein n=1 Tax=Laspinema olomoucense TaxID=3231600 RepID=UPI0021BAA7C5|nr:MULTISPECIES: hypothetical protein [unclassified Laspinema]MCT7974356.1 hypothetical protein [Laspinema sp. D3d]MCT7990735.1 hypothetical protein [Laspinema sp. D3a]